jgi:multiple sugar transport system ATP-binding protein
VQQVGTPTEIYDRPANAFVASFIGSPAMNLVEGELKGGTFTALNVVIDGLNGPDGPATLGFRAEDAEAAEAGQVSAPIYSLELLGDATMITVKSGSALVSVKAHKDFRAEIGAAFAATVSPDMCHLFHSETGERL